jgi:hypothetical protein
MQDDPVEQGSDPGVEPGTDDAPPDEAGLEDMRPAAHDPGDELP